MPNSVPPLLVCLIALAVLLVTYRKNDSNLVKTGITGCGMILGVILLEFMPDYSVYPFFIRLVMIGVGLGLVTLSILAIFQSYPDSKLAGLFVGGALLIMGFSFLYTGVTSISEVKHEDIRRPEPSSEVWRV